MKIQLTYDRPSQIRTDLLVVVLDEDKKLHDLSGSPLQETLRRIGRDFKDKKLKMEYFTALDSKSGARNLLVFSTGLNKAHNIWETLKTLVARSVRIARDHGFQRVAIALNTVEAEPFVGKAIEGAVLGGYTFDRYKKEKSTLDGLQLQLAVLKEHDSRNRHYLDRYTLVSNVVNEARDMINEPGSVVTPHYMAETAQAIGEQSDLDVTIWDEKRLQKDGYNGLLQVGRGSAHPPRLIRLAYRTKKAKHHVAFVGKGVTFDSGGISLKPADKMFEMKGDMSGGAAVLYAMKAIGKLRPPVNVTGIVPTAENFPDANDRSALSRQNTPVSP